MAASRHGFAVVVVATLLLAGTAAGAQEHRPASTGRLSLEEAVAEALTHAPSLRAAMQQSDAAAAKAMAADRTRFGQLDAVAGYWRYQDNQILRPMSRELFGPRGFLGLPFDNDQTHYGLVFQLPLYTGGRLDASASLAAIQTNQSSLLVDSTRWEVRGSVTAFYASVLSLQAAGRATASTLEALTATRRRLALAVEQGKRPRLDLLKIDDELAEARSRQLLLEAEATRVRALLLAAIGHDPSDPIELDPVAEADLRVTVDDRELRSMVRSSSPVKRVLLQVDQAGQAERIARAALLPVVSGRANLMGNAALGLGEHLTTWDFSVAVTVPLFDGGARRADLAAARAQAQSVAASAEKTALDREALAVELRARFEAGRAARDAARARVSAAHEAARIEQLRYDAGSGTIEDLLRARARQEGGAAMLAQAQGDLLATAARLNAVCESEVVR